MNHTERRDRRRKMADEVRKGGTLLEVAGRFRMSPTTVHKACVEHAVTVNGYSLGPSPKSFKILKHLLDGQSQADAARTFGVSRQRVTQIALAAREAGFEV